MEEITLTIRDGKPMATSIQIAESFEKRHDNIIRDIRNLTDDLKNTPDGRAFNARNFAQITYKGPSGRMQSAYELTRDGFTMLAMGFTGEKALQFKMAYIDAFNRMEAKLTQDNLPALPGLPPYFKPDLDILNRMDGDLRNAYEAVFYLKKVQEKIDGGKGYMLPLGMELVKLPEMIFCGWYSEEAVYVVSDALSDVFKRYDNFEFFLKRLDPYVFFMRLDVEYPGIGYDGFVARFKLKGIPKERLRL